MRFVRRYLWLYLRMTCAKFAFMIGMGVAPAIAASADYPIAFPHAHFGAAGESARPAPSPHG
jgi:hypothetical protein